MASSPTRLLAFGLLLMSISSCERAGDADPSTRQGDTEVGTVVASMAPPSADASSLQQRLATAGERYKQWIPERSFISAAAIRGAPIDADEAIALTADDHVGVTRDGGKSWRFSPHPHARVRDVAGYPGGPYVAVGSAGYVAFSSDGVSWRELPRYSTDELTSVITSPAGIVAISKTGTFVRYDHDGSQGQAGQLPDRFRPSGLLIQFNGVLVASGRRRAYATGDGIEWTALESRVRLPEPNTATTRAGSCRIEKLGKTPGVVCSVAGIAHGLPGDRVAIAGTGSISTTRDGGNTWEVAALSRAAIRPSQIAASEDGPLVAVGPKGFLATSSDGGRHFVVRDARGGDDLNDVLMDNAQILVVGNNGTLLHSGDRGQTWQRGESPIAGDFSTVEKRKGRFVAHSRAGAVSSRDGLTWRRDRKIATRRRAPRLGKCNALPKLGHACWYSRSSTTPRDLPRVRGLFFDGDRGLAVGDESLLALTNDGGLTWEISRSFGLAKIRGFATRNQHVLVTDGRRIVASSDAGESFSLADRPGRTTLNTVFLATDTTAYAAGRSSTLLRSRDHQLWESVETPATRATNYTSVFEVDGNLYLAGAEGGLWRSTDGTTFTTVNLGTGLPVQAMTGENDVVLAVTTARKAGGNVMLRSDDAGRHFYFVRELSHRGPVDNLELADGTLRYRDRRSYDHGASWMPAGGSYWPGAVALPDDSGLRLARVSARATPDRLYIVGDEPEQWLLIETPVRENADLACDVASGCWLVATNAIYRAR